MRYGLRTLLVVVTVLCGVMAYVGYGLNWARERQHFMRGNREVFFVWAPSPFPPANYPPLLLFLGEPPLAEIYVTVPTIAVQPDGSEVNVPDPSRMVPRIKRLFPEAKVNAFPYRTLADASEELQQNIVVVDE
jgi:hypothetical protein